jgi:hypothetical protein
MDDMLTRQIRRRTACDLRLFNNESPLGKVLLEIGRSGRYGDAELERP